MKRHQTFMAAAFITVIAALSVPTGCVKELPEDDGNSTTDTTDCDYDYEFEATLQSGDYYSAAIGGGHNFYTWLSDMPFDANGYTQSGGTYYLFDLFSPAPQDPDNPMLPAGSYTLGEPGAIDEFTFTPDYSLGITINEDGTARTMDAVFSEGTLDISIEGDGYVFDARLVDQDGKTHHVTYRGPAAWHSDPLPYTPIGDDLNITPTDAFAQYISEDDGIMCVSIRFTDAETALTAKAYMPFDENGSLAAGTYEVTVIPGDALTLSPGEILDISGELFPLGTYAFQTDGTGAAHYGPVHTGSMTISGNGGQYSIECDFTTAEGHSIACTYSGEMTVSGIPSGDGFSTLEGDYTLDLDNAVCSYASYFGDDYGTGGGAWYLMIAPEEGVPGDGLQVDLVGNSLDFEAGIPSGTYTAAPEGVLPEPGQYYAGLYDDGNLVGTMFLGEFDDYGFASQYAPATGGDLKITNHGDGLYTLSFRFLDDKGNTWDGEWTGTLLFDDYSTFAAAASRSTACSGGSSARLRPSPDESCLVPAHLYMNYFTTVR